MYPKVKVRDEAQDDDDDDDDYTTRFFKALDALSLHDYPSPPVKELKDNSLPSVVRIPKSYVSKPVMPMAPVSRGSAKSINKKIEEEKPNIRASSVPRPRAVLSSPGTFISVTLLNALPDYTQDLRLLKMSLNIDNDEILKSKQKSRPEISSCLKNHNLCQNRHVQCKVIPRSIGAEGRPINKTRETNEAAQSRINPKRIMVSPSAGPNKKGYLRKE